MRTLILVCFSLSSVVPFSQDDTVTDSYLIAGGVVDNLGSVQYIEAASVTFFDLSCPLQVLENVKLSINRTKDQMYELEILIENELKNDSIHNNGSTLQALNSFKDCIELTLRKLEIVAENPWVANATKNDAYNFKELSNFTKWLLEDYYSPYLTTFELIVVNVFDNQSRTTMKEGTSFPFSNNSHQADIDELNKVIDEILTTKCKCTLLKIWSQELSLSPNLVECHYLNSLSDAIISYVEAINAWFMLTMGSHHVLKPFIHYKVFTVIDDYAQKQLNSEPIVSVENFPEFLKQSSFRNGSGDYHLFMITPYVSHYMNRLYRILPFPTLPFPNSHKRVTLNINKGDIFVVSPKGAITSMAEDDVLKCETFDGKEGTRYACFKPRYPQPANPCVSNLLHKYEAKSCMYSIYPSNDIFHEQIDLQIYISLPSNMQTGHYYCRNNAIKPFRSITVASAFCGIRINETVIRHHLFVPLGLKHPSHELDYPDPPTVSPSQIIGYNVPSNHTTITVPSNHTTITVASNHTTITVPSNHTTIPVPSNRTTITVPLNHTTITVPLNHTTITVPSNHTTITVPSNHTTITVPSNHTTITASLSIVLCLVVIFNCMFSQFEVL